MTNYSLIHILLWLEKRPTSFIAADIDSIVSAELPDKDQDPIGYAAVSTFMMHGPCGAINTSAQCMESGKCKKFYPKPFKSCITIDEDGFPHYRRKETSTTTMQSGIELDNRFVVPHNVDLVVKYQAHINVEVCNRTRAVKYLFKYISKGPDRSKAAFESTSQSPQLDDI